MKLPIYVENTLKILESKQYTALLVGGCVRDELLGRRPKDFDIATDATPDVVQALFSRTVATGAKFGTVRVLYGKNEVEVSTFRTESAYSDKRHPDSVKFTLNIEEDLARRDFSVNAMALSLRGDLSDPFGGRVDLERKIIRCVGNAQDRFSEDALRMLRALRFCAQLDFTLDADTLTALKRCASECSTLSAERVREELMKTLCSPKPEYAGDMIKYKLLENYLEDKNCDLSTLGRLPQYARLTHFCHALKKSGAIDEVGSFLRSLRFSRTETELCIAACKLLDEGMVDAKRALRDYGAPVVRAAYPRGQVWRAVLRSGECYSVDLLNISGAELHKLGYSGADIGAELRRLLELVIDDPSLNSRETLLSLARQNFGGMYE